MPSSWLTVPHFQQELEYSCVAACVRMVLAHYGESRTEAELRRLLDTQPTGRVTVGTVLGLLAAGTPRERILQAYPYLEPDDIDAALAYAAWRLEEREEALVGA
jgi:hypothetical protein